MSCFLVPASVPSGCKGAITIPAPFPSFPHTARGSRGLAALRVLQKEGATSAIGTKATSAPPLSRVTCWLRPHSSEGGHHASCSPAPGRQLPPGAALSTPPEAAHPPPSCPINFCHPCSKFWLKGSYFFCLLISVPEIGESPRVR